MKKILLVFVATVVLMATQSVEARVYTKCPAGQHVDPITFQCVPDVPPPPPPPPAGGVLCANPGGNVTYETACSASQTPIVIPQPETNIPLDTGMIVWFLTPFDTTNAGTFIHTTDAIYDLILDASGDPCVTPILDLAMYGQWIYQYYYKLRCVEPGYVANFPPGTPVCP